MKTSVAMQEIRKIRDENSSRHINMTSEELSKEFDESVEKFMKALGREVRVISSEKILV